MTASVAALNLPRRGAGRGPRRVSKGSVVAGSLAALVVAGAFVGQTTLSNGASDASMEIDRAEVTVAPSMVSREADDTLALNGASDGSVRSVGAPESLAADAVLPTPTPAIGYEQKLIRETSIGVEVGSDDMKSVYDRLTRIAGTYGGQVTQGSFDETERRDGSLERSAVVTFTVPSDKYDDAVSAVRELGLVRSESATSTDVTGTVIDIDARIRNLQAEEQTYLQLMAKATTTADIISIQQQITSIRTQIESYLQQAAYYAAMTANSTFTVSLAEPRNATTPDAEPTNTPMLQDAADDAGEAFLTTVGGMLVVLAWLVPYLAAALLLAVVFRVATRRNRRAVPAPAAGMMVSAPEAASDEPVGVTPTDD